MFARISITTLCAGLLLAAGCTQSSNSNSNVPIPGGYSAESTQSADVIAAAEFAVAEQSKSIVGLKLRSIESVQTQVVAGRNFELVLKVVNGGIAKTARAVVYIDLTDTKSLTSWVWL